MLAFLIAYLLVWLGLLGYVLRLAACQRRLQQAVLALQRRLEASHDAQEPNVLGTLRVP